jgi:hypothetical protein
VQRGGMLLRFGKKKKKKKKKKKEKKRKEKEKTVGIVVCLVWR